MHPRISPWRFLARLLVLFAITFAAWQPLAPLYARVLFHAARAGVWLCEFSSDPTWQHPTELLMRPERSPTAIFYTQTQLFPRYGLPPQGIPAEWVMANLVLLIPLMLATPAASWRERGVKLAIAFGIALVLQVADIAVAIKSFYAAAFRGVWSPWVTSFYQFLDAFFQSWDTQLFPFAIWAGVNFRQLLPARLFPAATSTTAVRAERRRQHRSGRP